MKRILAIILAAMMLTAVLAACGGDAKDTDTDSTAAAAADTGSAVDLGAVLSDINSRFGFEGLKVLEDTKALNRYYSISDADVKQFAAELTTTASQYTEVVIVEANDDASAQNVKNQLQAHLDTQLNTAKSYDADQVAMIEACSPKQKGNFVYLVVSDQQSEIDSVIEAAIK